MAFEIEVIKFLQSGRTPFFDCAFQIITQLGSVLGVLFACILLLCFSRKLCFWYLFSYGFVGLAVKILKGCVERIRPYNVCEEIISIGSSVTDYSFPSGHAACATAIAIFLGYFLFQRFKKVGTRVWIVVACSVYVALVCLSRMYLGMHYLTDVVAGVVLSVLICLFGILFMRFCQKYKEKRNAVEFGN